MSISIQFSGSRWDEKPINEFKCIPSTFGIQDGQVKGVMVFGEWQIRKRHFQYSSKLQMRDGETYVACVKVTTLRFPFLSCVQYLERNGFVACVFVMSTMVTHTYQIVPEKNADLSGVEFISIPVVGVYGCEEDVRTIFKEAIPVRVNLNFDVDGGDEEFKECLRQEEEINSAPRFSSFSSTQSPLNTPHSRPISLSQTPLIVSSPLSMDEAKEEKVERMDPENGGILSFFFGGKETPLPYKLLANKAKKRNMRIDFTLFFELDVEFSNFTQVIRLYL